MSLDPTQSQIRGSRDMKITQILYCDLLPSSMNLTCLWGNWNLCSAFRPIEIDCVKYFRIELDANSIQWDLWPAALTLTLVLGITTLSHWVGNVKCFQNRARGSQDIEPRHKWHENSISYPNKVVWSNVLKFWTLFSFWFQIKCWLPGLKFTKCLSK